jgi:hypothetical protein
MVVQTDNRPPAAVTEILRSQRYMRMTKTAENGETKPVFGFLFKFTVLSQSVLMMPFV